MIVGRVEREAHLRRERRLELACLARTQPRDAQAKRLAEGKLALELAGLILIPREEQRPGPEQLHLDARRRRKLLGERRPQLGRAQSELEHLAPRLAELDLHHRGQHARGDARGGLPALVALEQGDRHSALPRTPRYGQPDDAAPDDEDIGSVNAGHGLMLARPVIARLQSRECSIK